jgi:hypothetical protein
MKRLFLSLTIVLTLAGCYGLPPATESAVKDAIAANTGHMNDQGLPAQARAVAQDNHDVLWQVLFGAGNVDELPAEVRERMNARAGGGDK